MAYGELDMMPVQHRHQMFFEIVVRADRHPLAEDRLAIDRFHGQRRLEDVGFVLGTPFFLSVDEEQRDHPVRIPLADLSLNVDVTEQSVRSLGLDRFILERQFDHAASVVPLPDPDWLAGAFVDPIFPNLPLVLPPQGRDLDRLGVRIDTEGHPDGGRQMPSGNGHVLVGGSVVHRVTAPFGQFVGDERRLFVLFLIWRAGGVSPLFPGPTRCQHADDVAIPHGALGQFLALTPGWAEQVADDHCFEFGSNLAMVRNGG